MSRKEIPASNAEELSKTRKAFEKQLIQQGMSKENAKRLRACFEDLKDKITGMLKQGIRLSAN